MRCFDKDTELYTYRYTWNFEIEDVELLVQQKMVDLCVTDVFIYSRRKQTSCSLHRELSGESSRRKQTEDRAEGVEFRSPQIIRKYR